MKATKRLSDTRAGRVRERITGAMGKKRALEVEGQVDGGQVEPVRPDFSDLLVDRVLDQLDLASLASKLAPDLARKLASMIQLDALGDRVFEKLADRLANDPIIPEAIVVQVSRLMGENIAFDSPPP